ncbi:MAG: hypothetical protein RL662_1765 [Bacteroidota bacterium]|jgi:Zn-dependent M28 family amino/carboxypeptidase
MIIQRILFSCSLITLIACGGGSKNITAEGGLQGYQKVSPDFNADTAFYFVDKQVTFGPRVPNSEAHVACGDYLAAQLRRFGAEVTEQKADLKAFDGTILKSRNIIGSYNTQNPNRILLFAHWDTRMFSDQDPDEKLHRTPVQGANDGASGIGVLLEIARVIQTQSPNYGVDIIFFDSEDNGTPDFVTDAPSGEWWCLGSQYWSTNPHLASYKARYGILLDMVGAPDATFHKERYSKEYAGDVLAKIWSTARDLGYGKHFVDKDGIYVMDDHIPVIQNLGIPSVDIIHYDANTETKFGWYWHTSKDNMDNISKETLKAVGQTVLEVVYKEKGH